MKILKNLTGDSLEQMIDYKVVDQNGDSIGTLHSLWSDPTTGAVEFLGVKTGWLFGSNHVVPAEKAELDEEKNVVSLPYNAAFIKDAPSVSAEAEITEDREADIYRYYGLELPGGVSNAPGNNQPGVKYDETSGRTPEAIGGAAIANASEAGTGGTQFGGPTSTDADATLPGVSRLRRTSRPDSPMQSAMGGSQTDATSPTMPSATPSASGNTPGTFASSNMFGSTATATASVAPDSLGASTTDAGASSISDSLADRFGSNVTDPGDPNADLTRPKGDNADPITGEPGAHPVGTGAGALAGGAAGAAIGGAIGGPVGAPVGAVVGVIAGALGGGYAGKGIAESINPTDEEAYWRDNFRHAPYSEDEYEYSDYSPAYRAGYEGYGRHAATGKDYPEVEGELEHDYNANRGTSKLTWEKAKAATRDAWNRVKEKAGDPKNS